MNTTRRTLLLLIVALGPAGCSGPTLMPTPVAFDSGVDPIAETPVTERDTTARVFIVTDRKPSDRTDSPADFYSNDRDYGLRVGVATVELARDMTWDELHAQSLETKRTRKPKRMLQPVWFTPF